MELRDIEYFAVVAEHRHLGRAAEALDLTQPALSKSLRRLEQAMGAKLVKRTPKGVELTAEGAALMSHVRQLRLSLADVAREISDVSAGRAGQLRLGAAPGFVDDIVLCACSAVVKDAPHVTLTVTVAANDVLLPSLRNGELDLIVSGIPALPFGDLVQEHLFDDEIVAIASADHRLAHQGQVTLADVAQERWAVTIIDPERWTAVRKNAYELSGADHRGIALRTSYLPLRDQMVAHSNLLGMSSRRYLRQISPRLKLVELPVTELMQTRRVGVSYRKDAYSSPVVRRFIELLKAIPPRDRAQVTTEPLGTPKTAA
jgi:DNA-binding transcriptional LysR family regulator